MLNFLHIQANVLFSNELAKRYADKGIVSIALSPGTYIWHFFRAKRANGLLFLTLGSAYTNLTRTTPSVQKFILVRTGPRDH